MARRGRKRQPGPRTPSGRLIKDATVIPEQQIAMRVRAGIPEKVARTCGTMEDAFYEARLITFEQLQAARHFIMLRHKHFIELDDTNVPRDPRKSGGGGPDAYEAFCEHVRRDYEAAKSAVQRKQRELKDRTLNLWYALECFSSPYGQFLEGDRLEDLKHGLDAIDELINPKGAKAA